MSTYELRPEGLCYSCRHLSTTGTGHCYGGGDLEPTEGMWAGFRCTCGCRPAAPETNGERPS